METRAKLVAAEAARKDLSIRTLAKLQGELARLVYLASTRDYTTGQYQHDGLAREFSREAAAAALKSCHEEIFRTLGESSLEDIVEELEVYACANHIELAELIRTWENLQPYRIARPLECDPLTAELFASNITVALTILRSRCLLENRRLPDA